MTTLLPPTDQGYLPLVVFVVAVTSFGNVIQAYTTLSYTQRVYSRTNVTPISARTFGTWTTAVGIARLYACYRMNDPAWYQLSMWTNVVGLLHYMSELLIFKTCTFWGPWLAPAGIASSCLLWHAVQYDNYVG